ncbi:DUF3977 family protein [Bacillus sp. SJS]|uniref:DUF3977 family protein n=1 Tax=Bacillus sp. SJS TaxID=1423321 RepID=UPI0004DD5B02|nr:DUF3977 family protein [Bacillus sp. SJS]KZZ84589.1 hypothetical protein AS29_010480 [Bacillus sp. SJS]
MKYIEFGIGNKRLIRTETEKGNGIEVEEKGLSGPIYFCSIYLRIWIHYDVLIIDYKEGVKRLKKNRKSFKMLMGIVSS